MAHTFLKAEKIAATALGLLQREIVLPGLVWRNAGGSFKGAAGDTVTLKVPARTSAKPRQLRATRGAGSLVEYSDLTQLSVDVTLDKALYNAVPISDEELILDIESFGADILAPQVRAVVEAVENEVADQMTGASYASNGTFTVDADKPVNSLIDARKYLNDNNVPNAGRVVVVGSALEAAFLKSDQLQRVDHSGSDSALRDPTIGRAAGFQIVTSNALPEDFGCVFHRTAFVLNLVAPAITNSQVYGATQSSNGLSLRWLRDWDFEQVQDRSLVDVYVGTNEVVDPENASQFNLRAAKLTLGS